MMHAHNLPPMLWAEAVTHSNYIKNRVPTSAIKEPITPYERFWKTKPNVDNLHEFGVSCWVLDRDPFTDEVGREVTHAFPFMGISGESKCFKYYDAAARKIKKSRDIRFTLDASTPTEIELIPPPLEGEKAAVEQSAGTPGGAGGVSADLPAQKENEVAPVIAPVAPRRSARTEGSARPNYAIMNDLFRRAHKINHSDVAVDYALTANDAADP